jgi:hypothetical protein
MIHELGHGILNHLDLHALSAEASLGYFVNGEYIHITGLNLSRQYQRTNRGYKSDGRPHQQHSSSFDDWESSPLEDHADMIMNWALADFSNDIAGDLRMNYMNGFMEAALNAYFGGQ